MRVGYFTAGTVGAGHLARGVALERAFVRAGSRVDFRMFGAALPFSAARRDGVTAVPLSAEELADPIRARNSALARALSEFAPELLLVDLFWAPLHHLLPLRGCEAWLLLRSHPRHWLIGPPDTPFDRSKFARVFTIEPHLAAAESEQLEPIVIANRDELRPRADLRRALDVDDAAHLTLIVHAGLPGEREALVGRARAQREATTIRIADLYEEKALFPIATFLAGAHRIVGGAGYNLFWETRALGLADRTTLVPFARALDDQARRIEACSHHVPKENGADALVELIRA